MKPAFTAGVALLGAGVITCAPVEPAAAVVPVVDTAVQLSAIPSPLELYPQVLARAVQNSVALVEAYLADPLPLTRLTIEKQIAALGQAFEAFADGDAAAAAAAVGRVIAAPVATVFGALEYVDTLMNQPNAPQALFQIALSPILSGIAAFGVAIDEAVDAAAALDLVGLLNAVVNIPARIVDGVLNGGYGSPLGNFDNLPGLVTPLTVEGYLFPGPIALAILIDQDAADYIEDQDEQQDVGEVAAAGTPQPLSVDEAAVPDEDEPAVVEEAGTDDPQASEDTDLAAGPEEAETGEDGAEPADTAIDGQADDPQADDPRADDPRDADDSAAKDGSDAATG